MLLKVLELLLQALLPLLERRTTAAERQAEYTERQYNLLRLWLAYQDPTFAEVLEGRQAVEDPEAVDVYAEHGESRDLKAARLEELRALWFQQHGELLDDDRLVAEYERLYADAEARFDADAEARVN